HFVDRPGFRKIHAYPIPRLGGVTIATAYAIGLLALNLNNDLGWKILPGAGVIFTIGILDDFMNLPAWYKLLGQTAAACIAFWMGIRIPGPLAISFVVTVFCLLLAANSFNLIDGLDGLCTGMGLISTLALFLLGSIESSLALQKASLPLLGAAIGFLCYNFSRATIFLGDSGALLIGFLVGCCGVIWTMEPSVQGAALAAPLLLAAIPLMEVILSVARRWLRRRPLFAADQGHIHHRLLARGLTRRGAVLTLYAWAIAGCIFAGALAYRPFRQWQLLLIAGFAVTASAGVWQLKYPEFTEAAQLLARGQFRKALGGRDAG
ncbi:MAG TPA: MraY family glycosyltransferase, partial [Candidatus Angelobacter sp.]|nr:MraY family glycosyltransferase [Candidatus Angelobacter sp.]